MLALNANDPLFREPCLLHLSGLVKAGHWFPAKENRSDRSATAKARPDVESAYPEISDRALPPEAFPPYCIWWFHRNWLLRRVITLRLDLLIVYPPS